MLFEATFARILADLDSQRLTIRQLKFALQKASFHQSVRDYFAAPAKSFAYYDFRKLCQWCIENEHLGSFRALLDVLDDKRLQQRFLADNLQLFFGSAVGSMHLEIARHLLYQIPEEFAVPPPDVFQDNGQHLRHTAQNIDLEMLRFLLEEAQYAHGADAEKPPTRFRIHNHHNFILEQAAEKRGLKYLQYLFTDAGKYALDSIEDGLNDNVHVFRSLILTRDLDIIKFLVEESWKYSGTHFDFTRDNYVFEVLTTDACLPILKYLVEDAWKVSAGTTTPRKLDFQKLLASPPSSFESFFFRYSKPESQRTLTYMLSRLKPTSDVFKCVDDLSRICEILETYYGVTDALQMTLTDLRRVVDSRLQPTMARLVELLENFAVPIEEHELYRQSPACRLAADAGLIHTLDELKQTLDGCQRSFSTYRRI